MKKESTAVAPAPNLRRETRVCPRCGQSLFADMDVCYGCLYDFARRHHTPMLPQPQVTLTDDLDEPLSPEAAVVLAKPPRPPETEPAPVVAVLVRTGDVDVTVEVPASGLHVGRSPANDVVLHSKAVSREHAVLMPAQEGVIVSDLGSTNPPLVRGRPIEGSALVPFGTSFLLCGSHFEPRQGR